MNDIEMTARSKKGASDFLKSEAFVMLCIYAGALLIHVLLSLCTTIFNLTPDEYSVTAIGAYLNGYDWSSTVSTGGYYGYFQGLLYTPIYLLTDDPYLRYDLMIVMNDIIISVIPVIIYYLGRRAFDINRGPALLFAFVSGLYPCYVLLTKFTWNETMCNTLPWVFLLLAYKSVDCSNTVKKQVFSVLGGLTLMAGYATHGRMLSLLAAGVVLVLAYFLITRKRIFCFTGFFASIVVGFVADNLLKDFFQDALWLINDIDKVPTNTIEKMISRILAMDMEAIGNFFKTLIGHFFYFISATWGFGAICLVLIISALVIYIKRCIAVRKAEKTEGPVVEAYISDNDGLLTLFAFLAMGAVFVVSVFFKATSTVLDSRADTMIYGRYTEVFYPIAIFATMILIYRGKLTFIHSFASLVAASVINTLTMTFVAPCVTAGERMVSAMIMGLMPLRYGEKVKDIPTNDTFLKIIITTMAVLFVIVIIHLIRKNDEKIYKFIAVPLAGLLLYTNVICYTSYNLPQAKSSLVGANHMEEALEKLDGSGFTVHCFALAKERYVKAQFLYPEMNFKVVTNFSALSKLEERPDFIVSDREDALQLWLDGVYLVGDINSDSYLYACSEEAYEWAKAEGLALSENGYVEYSGAEIPATEDVEKTEAAAVMPVSTAVYTNYALIYKAGTYYFTVYGDGVDRDKLTVTLTSNKGESKLDYTVVEQADGVLKIAFTVDKKTENVRFKLSNNTGAEVVIDRIVFEKDEAVNNYAMAKRTAQSSLS